MCHGLDSYQDVLSILMTVKNMAKNTECLDTFKDALVAMGETKNDK